MLISWESAGAKEQMLSSREDLHCLCQGGGGTWELGHIPRFAPVSSPDVCICPQDRLSFCMGWSLAAPVLVLPQFLVFGGTLGISLTFGEPRNALKSIFYSRFSGFAEGGPSEPVSTLPQVGILLALRTVHPVLLLFHWHCGARVCPSALPQRSPPGQWSRLSISLSTQPGSW